MFRGRLPGLCQDIANLLRKLMKGEGFLDKPFAACGQECFNLFVDAVTA
jgi:hypothetical protein